MDEQLFPDGYGFNGLFDQNDGVNIDSGYFGFDIDLSASPDETDEGVNDPLGQNSYQSLVVSTNDAERATAALDHHEHSAGHSWNDPGYFDFDFDERTMFDIPVLSSDTLSVDTAAQESILDIHDAMSIHYPDPSHLSALAESGTPTDKTKASLAAKTFADRVHKAQNPYPIVNANSDRIEMARNNKQTIARESTTAEAQIDAMTNELPSPSGTTSTCARPPAFSDEHPKHQADKLNAKAEVKAAATIKPKAKAKAKARGVLVLSGDSESQARIDAQVQSQVQTQAQGQAQAEVRAVATTKSKAKSKNVLAIVGDAENVDALVQSDRYVQDPETGEWAKWEDRFETEEDDDEDGSAQSQTQPQVQAQVFAASTGTAQQAFSALYFDNRGPKEKLVFEQDDVTSVVTSEVTDELSKEMFDALLKPYAVAAEKWRDALKEKYNTVQDWAFACVKIQLSTQHGVEAASRRIKVIINSAILLHTDGLPVDELTQRGPKTKSSYQVDCNLTCLARVKSMIHQVATNKAVAKDAISLNFLHDFACAPIQYAKRKIDNISSNLRKEEMLKEGRSAMAAKKTATTATADDADAIGADILMQSLEDFVRHQSPPSDDGSAATAVQSSQSTRGKKRGSTASDTDDGTEKKTKKTKTGTDGKASKGKKARAGVSDDSADVADH